MTINPKDAAEVASSIKTGVDVMRGLYETLKNRRLGKKQKQQIKEEASKLLRLATSDEIDKYVADPRRKKIDYMTGAAEVGRPRAVKAAKKVRKRGGGQRRSLMVRKRR